MADHDIGMLPILDGARLVGVVTDRDIAVRGVAAGISSHAPVRRIMSKHVSVCSPDDDIEAALDTMGQEQIRRMPVCNQFHEVIGVIALADIAPHAEDEEEVGEILCKISEPTGVHSQAPTSASAMG
jgi:CBS-domain-containing membrane protein